MLSASRKIANNVAALQQSSSRGAVNAKRMIDSIRHLRTVASPSLLARPPSTNVTSSSPSAKSTTASIAGAKVAAAASTVRTNNKAPAFTPRGATPTSSAASKPTAPLYTPIAAAAAPVAPAASSPSPIPSATPIAATPAASSSAAAPIIDSSSSSSTTPAAAAAAAAPVYSREVVLDLSASKPASSSIRSNAASASNDTMPLAGSIDEQAADERAWQEAEEAERLRQEDDESSANAKPALRVMAIGLAIIAPLGLYHLSHSFRDAVDGGLGSIGAAYTAAFPPKVTERGYIDVMDHPSTRPVRVSAAPAKKKDGESEKDKAKEKELKAKKVVASTPAAAAAATPASTKPTTTDVASSSSSSSLSPSTKAATAVASIPAAVAATLPPSSQSAISDIASAVAPHHPIPAASDDAPYVPFVAAPSSSANSPAATNVAPAASSTPVAKPVVKSSQDVPAHPAAHGMVAAVDAAASIINNVVIAIAPVGPSAIKRTSSAAAAASVPVDAPATLTRPVESTPPSVASSPAAPAPAVAAKREPAPVSAPVSAPASTAIAPSSSVAANASATISAPLAKIAVAASELSDVVIAKAQTVIPASKSSTSSAPAAAASASTAPASKSHVTSTVAKSTPAPAAPKAASSAPASTPAPSTPAPSTPAPSAPSSSASPSSPTPTASSSPTPSIESHRIADIARAKADRLANEKIALAIETLQLAELSQQLDELIRLDREPSNIRQAKTRSVGPVPATKALRELKAIYAAEGLNSLPNLPTPPSWSRPATTIEEAQERLNAIEQFKRDYSEAMNNNQREARNQISESLTAKVDSLMARARAEFKEYSKSHYANAKRSTSNALQSNEMSAKADISSSIIDAKSKEWISEQKIPIELAKAADSARQDTSDALKAQSSSLHAELEPLVQSQMQSIRESQAEVKRLDDTLSAVQTQVKEGERVAAITLAIQQLEANLFDNAAPIQTDGKAWQRDWSKLTELTKSDPKLKSIMQSSPSASSSSSSSSSSCASFPCPESTLRRTFNVDIEPALRQSSFLPPSSPAPSASGDDESTILRLLASTAASASKKEGQTLRLDASSDADRINNASFYLNQKRDLQSAIGELEQLSSARAKSQVSEWINQARNRVIVEDKVRQMRKAVESQAKAK